MAVLTKVAVINLVFLRSVFPQRAEIGNATNSWLWRWPVSLVDNITCKKNKNHHMVTDQTQKINCIYEFSKYYEINTHFMNN